MIRLEAVEEPDVPVIPNTNTPAIIGVAILGGTILGKTDGVDEPNMPKLATPVIRLEENEELPRLSVPVIRLETVEDPNEPDEQDGNTPAILGVAILDGTILSAYGNSLPKLDTPTIRLVVVADDAPKLNTPRIELVTISDTEEPTVPVVPRLESPTIQLVMVPDSVEPDEPDIPEEPVIQKLDTPIIRLEVDAGSEPEEPEESDPVITKLDAPVINLESDAEQEPDIPDEPDEPDLPQLDTPTIKLRKDTEIVFTGIEHVNATNIKVRLGWEPSDDVGGY